MIKEAMQYFLEKVSPQTFTIDGHTFSDRVLNQIDTKEPIPAPIEISTLTGLIDYIKSGKDFNAKVLTPGGKALPQLVPTIIKITSPKEVYLVSPLRPDMRRNNYIYCSADTPRISFNNFIDAESFNILLQSCFIQDENTAAVLRVIGNIKESNVKESSDDGVSQQVVAKVGIVKLADVPVPNPVILRPFRTFTEVEQPASKFVLRMQDGPRAALFEADGGAWRNEAMQNIKEYLEKALQGYAVSVIS